MADFDLAIIGGGINGAGIARDAAGRGLRVLLVEQNDLASGTSSASTKLIHGGLRYLEHYAFRLVREALAEREVLCGWRRISSGRCASCCRTSRLRPAWMLRLGLFIYDHLGGRKFLPGTEDARSHASRRRRAAQARVTNYGFEYSDCWVDDARLVVLNARRCRRARRVDPHAHRLSRAERDGDQWRLVLNARGQPRGRDGARAGQRRRPLGRRSRRDDAAA